MRKAGLLSAAVLLAAGVGAGSARAAEAAPVTVVELFTSQGCSSCPPADSFLAELADRPGVLALSFHVDYWDYIGWKDPYSSQENTRRQREYARRFDLSYVYTPQIVVGGSLQTAGSNRAIVLDALRQRRSAPPVPVPDLKRDASGGLVIGLPALEGGDLWLIAYDREHVTAVQRGENRGATIRNRNVVRKIVGLGSWDGRPDTRRVETPPGKGGGLVLLVQSPRDGRIVSAGHLPPPPGP